MRQQPYCHLPCINCPFLKKGYIRLNRGRVRGIIDALLRDDFQSFPCHKTTHGDENAKDTAECAGAMIYRMKAGHPSVWMRVGMMTRKLDAARLMRSAPLIIDYPYKGPR